MKNIKRTLTVGLVWGLIFFLWWVKGFLYQNWNFDIFSKSSWAYLYNEFISGWVVSATSDWIFVWTLIFAIPLFLLGWNLFLKIQWHKSVASFFKGILYFLRKKTATVAKKKFKYAPKKSHQKTRPVPLHTSMKALEKNTTKAEAPAPAVELPKQEKRPAASAGNSFSSGSFSQMMEAAATPADSRELTKKPAPDSKKSVPSFLEDDDFTNISLDDIQVPERIALTENISDILLKAGYKVLSDVSFDNVTFDFIALDSTQILLISSDSEKGDWLADEERFNGEDPLWFSESSHRTSPVFKLVTAAEAFTGRLKQKGLMHSVKPILIEKTGNIINAEDMQSTWKEQGVLICRTDLGGPDELPSVASGIQRAEAPITEADFESIRDAF